MVNFKQMIFRGEKLVSRWKKTRVWPNKSGFLEIWLGISFYENAKAKWIYHFFATKWTSRNQVFSVFEQVLSWVLNVLIIVNKFLRTPFSQSISGRLLSKASFSLNFGFQAKSYRTVEKGDSVSIYINVNHFWKHD